MNKNDTVRVNGEMAVVRNVDESDCVMVEMRDGSEVWMVWDDDNEVWTRDDTGEEVDVTT